MIIFLTALDNPGFRIHCGLFLHLRRYVWGVYKWAKFPINSVLFVTELSNKRFPASASDLFDKKHSTNKHSRRKNLWCTPKILNFVKEKFNIFQVIEHIHNVSKNQFSGSNMKAALERRVAQQKRDCNLAIVLICTILMFLVTHTPRLIIMKMALIRIILKNHQFSLQDLHKHLWGDYNQLCAHLSRKESRLP